MKANKGTTRGAPRRARRKTKTKTKPQRTPPAPRVRQAAPQRGRTGVPAKARSKRTAAAAAAPNQEVELEAAVLRRLLRHFDERKDVQNIELMILAGFCRNCLSKWFVEAAQERGLELDIERAREKIYGMPYAQWKERHQQPATEDQLRRFSAAEQSGK
jgi:uncharacterized protein